MLQLLSKRHGDFVKRLTILRNHVAHRLEAVSFTFASYVDGLDEQSRQNTLNELLFLAGGARGEAGKRFAENPSLVVWAHALTVVFALVTRSKQAELQSQIEQQYREVAELVLNPPQEKS